MIPQSFIFAVTFIILFFPLHNSRELSIKSGELSTKRKKELRNYTPISINLHLNSLPVDTGENSNDPSMNQANPNEKILELPPGSFTEDPLQIESWMTNPKNWSTYKE